MNLAEHPTVRWFHENHATQSAPPTALDAAWLRQLCLDCGADDAGLKLLFQPGRAATLNAVYHFTFTGDEEAEATVTIRERTLQVQDGHHGDPDLRMTADQQDLARLREEGKEPAVGAAPQAHPHPRFTEAARRLREMLPVMSRPRRASSRATTSSSTARSRPDGPFGSAKRSGIGVEAGQEGLEELTQAPIITIAKEGRRYGQA